MRTHSIYDNDDQAARWVARMDAGGWSDENEAALEAWLAEDPLRRGALLQAQAAWISLEKGICSETVRPGQNPRLPRRHFLLGGGGALAASLVGGMRWARSGTTYSTTLGEIRRVPLADGSTATINSFSEVKIHLADKRRDVQIARGEAWFRVAKDPARPFVVEAGPIMVQAVGTAFSVRRRDNGADILVSEGVVEVWASQADGDRRRLVAGERAFLGDNAALRVDAGSPSAVDRALAWRAGSIDLAGETLADATVDFNRYNSRKLVLIDQRLADQRFDGVFRIDDPEGFASAVARSFDVPVDLASYDRIELGRRS